MAALDEKRIHIPFPSAFKVFADFEGNFCLEFSFLIWRCFYFDFVIKCKKLEKKGKIIRVESLLWFDDIKKKSKTWLSYLTSIAQLFHSNLSKLNLFPKRFFKFMLEFLVNQDICSNHCFLVLISSKSEGIFRQKWIGKRFNFWERKIHREKSEQKNLFS